MVSILYNMIYKLLECELDMILIINICKEDMHHLEFVKPIEDILSKSEISYITKKYDKLTKKDLQTCHRIIITGTSLADNSYVKHISKFNFLKTYTKPVLAICGGMQLLCLVHGCKLIKSSEIGLRNISFNSEFLGVQGSREVYTLHNFAVKEDEVLKKNFSIYSKSQSLTDSKIKIIQAVKHKHLKHYGLLFHPETRNKDMVVNFLGV